MRAVALVVLSVVVSANACVLPANGDLAEDCVDSDDCGRAELVCVLLDEQSSAGARVCLPMHDIEEPVACTANADCPAASYPVDATCVDDVCQCVSDTFDCGPDGLVLDALTCKCITP